MEILFLQASMLLPNTSCKEHAALAVDSIVGCATHLYWGDSIAAWQTAGHKPMQGLPAPSLPG